MYDFEKVLIDDVIFLRKLRRITDFLERHAVEIFRLDEYNCPDLEGSGILAKLDDRYYLVSAAHIFDACDKGVFLIYEGIKCEPLDGSAVVTGRKPGQTRLDDKADIGFIRLTEKETNSIGKDNFLDLDHISGPPMEINTTVFLVLGFPVRDQIRNNREHKIETPLTMFMTGNAKESAYVRSKTNSNTHILLRYNRRTIATKKSIGSPPDFRGFSGGGVWPISIFEEPTKDKPPIFAGIIIEQPMNYASSLLVTRSNLIRAFIKKFDIN